MPLTANASTCTDACCSQVTTHSRWAGGEKNLPGTNSFIVLKNARSFLASTKKKKKPNHLLLALCDCSSLWWSCTRRAGSYLTCEDHVTSSPQRDMCHGRGLLRVVLRDTGRRSSHTSSWLHIGCVKNGRKSHEMAKVCRALPWSSDTGTVGLSFCWTEPFQTDRRTGGGGGSGGGVWGRSIVHSGCLRILLWTEGRQRDLEKPVFEMCLHGKSQQATCFSILYLFYFTGLWATSQPGSLPLRSHSAWMTRAGCEARMAHFLHARSRARPFRPNALSFLNVTFNEFETTSSHIRLKS